MARAVYPQIGMFCAKSKTGLRLSAALCLAGTLLAVGCARHDPAPFTAPVTQLSSPDSLVFSSQPVRAWHASNAGQPGVGLIEADRFEYARNDSLLSPSSRAPLLATNQWPEAPRPAERPIRFWRWRQY